MAVPISASPPFFVRRKKAPSSGPTKGAQGESFHRGSGIICGLCLLLPALPAQATLIELGPIFYIDSLGGPSFTIENFEAGARTTNTSASGSGSAVSVVNDWDRAEIRTTLGTGPGEATASLTNGATFDLVFEGTEEFAFVFGFGLDGLGDAGVFSIDPGDTGFASWEMLVGIEGFPQFIDLQQESLCGDDRPAGSFCFNFFDSSETLFVGLPGDARRLSVSTVMSFDIGVSRAAVVSEPGALAMILLSLFWIRRASRVTRLV
jgi:hypothetical protein